MKGCSIIFVFFKDFSRFYCLVLRKIINYSCFTSLSPYVFYIFLFVMLDDLTLTELLFLSLWIFNFNKLLVFVLTVAINLSLLLILLAILDYFISVGFKA
jgi:hypothetical protein